MILTFCRKSPASGKYTLLCVASHFSSATAHRILHPSRLKLVESIVFCILHSGEHSEIVLNAPAFTRVHLSQHRIQQESLFRLPQRVVSFSYIMSTSPSRTLEGVAPLLALHAEGTKLFVYRTTSPLSNFHHGRLSARHLLVLRSANGDRFQS